MMNTPLADIEISASIKYFLETEFPNPGFELKEDTHLLNEWFVDSLGIINMIMFLETEFKTRITRAEINGENFRDIHSLTQFILAKAKKKT